MAALLLEAVRWQLGPACKLKSKSASHRVLPVLEHFKENPGKDTQAATQPGMPELTGSQLNTIKSILLSAVHSSIQ
eukprot:1157270-Pelagomonas_calceolata.AAC.5